MEADGAGTGVLGRGTQLRGQELGFFPQNGVQRPGKLDSCWLSNSLELLLNPGELCAPGRSLPTQASAIPFCLN